MLALSLDLNAVMTSQEEREASKLQVAAMCNDQDEYQRLRAANFVSWLLEDVDSVTAEVNTSRDNQLREFEREGLLRFTFSAHGENTYEIVTGGFRAFWDAASMYDRSLSAGKQTP